MFTTEDVGKEEAALQMRMPAGGYIEYRDQYIKEHGLYDAWRTIYLKYVKLAQGNDLEALKRATFYSWYQLSEPGWLSGISELPENQTRIVVDLLESYLGTKAEDEELKHMLRYYMAVCDYYLERFYPIPNIQNLSVGGGGLGRILPGHTNWEYRGQMGDYWNTN